jgi:hypothetical protein
MGAVEVSKPGSQNDPYVDETPLVWPIGNVSVLKIAALARALGAPLRELIPRD